MRRFIQPFVLTLFALLALSYGYVAMRLASAVWQRALLAIPFVLVWIVPLVYWGGERDRHGRIDELVHQASYVSMGWVSFVVVLAVARDALLAATAWPQAGETLTLAHAALAEKGVAWVYLGSLAALGIGMLAAFAGPRLRRVDIRIAGLHPDLEGLRIAQISDLHVGGMIRRRYVERVVELALSTRPDLVALTGDIVDGTVAELAPRVAPLARLARGRAFFIQGNHDCYSGMRAWSAHFRELGFSVLENEYETFSRGQARVLVGGVVDPAARMTDPSLVPRMEVPAEERRRADFRLFLAHNPKLAPLGARAGFDLQLSGHTHAGQFFPWTLAVRLLHAPHVAGLSREGAMWVYVSAGTGTWGPPVRLGTEPELTLIRLCRA